MPEGKLAYRLDLGGDLGKVTQQTYAELQHAITKLVQESGADWFRIERPPQTAGKIDADVRMLFVANTQDP